ncbi:MAG: hypothetical protein HXS54_01245 [Theionarchaea archaeon]|nr:hypothetical protein [Theionarchaea archaeon]
MNKAYLLTPVPFFFIIGALLGGINLSPILIASKTECIWAGIFIPIMIFIGRMEISDAHKNLRVFMVDLGTIVLSLGLCALIYIIGIEKSTILIVLIGIVLFIAIILGILIYLAAISDYLEEKDILKSIPETIEKGLCFVCRKRKVEEGKLKCKICNEETEQILAELRKEPGFTEIILEKGTC